MDNYYILRWFDEISEERVRLTARLYKNTDTYILAERHIERPFRNDMMLFISGDIPLEVSDDDAAILYFELIDGGELIYGGQF